MTEPALPQTWLEAIALMGHELRRPLTVIRGAATLLLEADDQLPAASRGELLGLIDRSVQGMSELIEDLTVAAHLDAGDLTLARDAVEVDELVVEASTDAARVEPGRLPSHPERHPGLRVEADRGQAVRALRLLLSRARQNATPDSEVELAVEVEPDTVRLLVLDRGPRIAEAETQVAFRPFSHSEAGATVGGVGLPLAQGLARAMGGDVSWSGRPGGGSTFSFTLNRRV